jgi:hypothetical protein
MRISRSTLSGTGVQYTPWVPVNYLQLNFNVALYGLPSAAISGLAYSAQYTADDQSELRPISWTQSTTTVTINDPVYQRTPGAQSLPHGMSTGDSVTIQGSGTGVLANGTQAVGFDGTYQVTVTSPTQYTITVTPSQTASGQGTVTLARVFTTTGIPAATAIRANTNLNQPATAVRLAVATMTGGTLDFLVIQGVD